MKLRTTFSILFWLKKTSIRENGDIPIYARIRLNNRRADITTRQFVTEENWSYSTQRVRITDLGANNINEVIEEFHLQIRNAYKQLLTENRPLTAQAVKKRVLGEDKAVQTCKDLMAYHRKHEIPKLAKGTSKNYGATERYLKRFMKHEFRTEDFYLTQIDYTFITRFERTCRPLNASQPLSNNGIMKPWSVSRSSSI